MDMNKYKIKGVINFASLTNPWIDHLSYAPNLKYKRVAKKGDKLYEDVDNKAKLCNLYTILAAPNAHTTCT